METILDHLDLRPGQVVVDAGCGNGYMAQIFARRVGAQGKVFALDPDRHAIGFLDGEVRGTCIETVVGDITTTTIIDAASVDLLYLSTVFHGFSRDRIGGFVAEARRILVPEGRLAIVEIEKKETAFGPPLHIRYSPRELRRALPLRPLETISVAEHFYMQTFEN